MQLDYGMVDADNHYYEPTDALTRYLPDERRRDVYWVSEVEPGASGWSSGLGCGSTWPTRPSTRS